jgi:hypothetical protein
VQPLSIEMNELGPTGIESQQRLAELGFGIRCDLFFVVDIRNDSRIGGLDEFQQVDFPQFHPLDADLISKTFCSGEKDNHLVG